VSKPSRPELGPSQPPIQRIPTGAWVEGGRVLRPPRVGESMGGKVGGNMNILNGEGGEFRSQKFKLFG